MRAQRREQGPRQELSEPSQRQKRASGHNRREQSALALRWSAVPKSVTLRRHETYVQLKQFFPSANSNEQGDRKTATITVQHIHFVNEREEERRVGYSTRYWSRRPSACAPRNQAGSAVSFARVRLGTKLEPWLSLLSMRTSNRSLARGA